MQMYLALAASLCWGASDFMAGLASRRAHPLFVTCVVYMGGTPVLGVMMMTEHYHHATHYTHILPLLGGLSSSIGQIAFCFAMAKGQMGLVSSVVAVVSTAIPALFGIFGEGFSGVIQVVGFVLILPATILIARPERNVGRPQALGLATVSGCGFGVYLLLSSHFPSDQLSWWLSNARVSAVRLPVFLETCRRVYLIEEAHRKRLPKNVRIRLFILRARNKSLRGRIIRQVSLIAAPPSGEAIGKVIPLMLGAGVIDILGNIGFVLGASGGHLAAASVLSSLFPLVTALLAFFFLRERLARLQWAGVALVLVAIILIVA